MARITKGILGGFSGKVGVVVGANYRGKDIIRSVPKPSSRKPTELQILQQKKFSMTAGFLQPLKPIQNSYFGAKSGSKSRVNLAAAYMLNNAFTLVLGEPVVVYNKILITKGELAGFQNAEATPGLQRIVNFTWEDNSLQGNASETDVVNVVCYCELLDVFEIFQTVATRIDLAAQIALSKSMQGQDVHVWLYMNNAAEKTACNSNYLGMLIIN